METTSDVNAVLPGAAETKQYLT